MPASDGPADSPRHRIRPRLAAMMFLQYFGLGAWVVPLSKFLGKSAADGGMDFPPPDVALIYTTFALGGLIAPLFVGLLADRFFAAEKLLAGLHVLMAGLLAAAGRWSRGFSGANADHVEAFGPLFWIMLAYAVCCLATLTLSNVISFRNLANPRHTFGRVRLFGTLGWIVSCLIVGFFLNPISAQPFFLASGSSVAMAMYAVTLPHTPPKGHGKPIAEIVGLPALKLLRDPAFVVFAVVAFVTNGLNQFYVLFANPNLDALNVWNPEVMLTLGQGCEMACMALVPILTIRFGLKTVMLLGLFGWILRALALWSGNVSLILFVAIPLHGWSYVFFTISASLFVDREAPPHLRAGAQALAMFLTSGPALLLGNFFAGRAKHLNTANGTTDWPALWLIPLVGYAVATVVFLVLFREPADQGTPPDIAKDIGHTIPVPSPHAGEGEGGGVRT